MIGQIEVYGGGRIHLGDRVFLDGSIGPIELHVSRGARLLIGDDVRINGGTSIEATEFVEIGDGVEIGSWSKVIDNHFHIPNGDRCSRPRSVPVRIDRGVRIGERCVVLPGAHLEEGVRLGHGVVVGRRVPARVALEGSPPRRAAVGGIP
ncbi:acyltransferase [Vulgatibacter incomptus]|uniref:Acetyltransferase n=1 Tax=Vulgatibacter incomptus TaxID=1391653 RepID=A0A0K1PD70_9BACT|nr:acetyltransferase [Vulgatibacter incomptus]AKU91447.1 Acetyltransferase [Vulgatibacter incomptus]